MESLSFTELRFNHFPNESQPSSWCFLDSFMLAHNFLSLIKDHSCHWEVFGSTSGKLQTRNVKKNKEIYFSPLTRRPEREVCNSATPQCLWELLSSSLSHYSAMFGCGGFFLVLKLEAPDVTIPYRSTTTN